MRLFNYILFLLSFFYSTASFAQCSVISVNGWIVDLNIKPLAVVPEFNSCPNYYHYEIKYQYSVTFTGTNINRDFNANIYFTCSGGTGGNIYQYLGNFSQNTTGTLTTSNNARQYTAISTNNYGNNPSCSQVTLAHVNCTSVRLDYWGNNVIGNSITCSLSSSTLPIDLIDFGAAPANGKVNLAWRTATEKNNHFFTVERSRDGVNFEEVARVSGSNNSEETKSYTTVDETPYKGISYYRLKQTDYTKNTKYFDMVSVDLPETKTMITSIYPNPAADDLSFTMQSSEKTTLNISITDLTGMAVTKEIKEIQPGNNKIDLSLSGLQKGIYFLRTETQTGFTAINKIVKN